jgi:hypothetical protein
MKVMYGRARPTDAPIQCTFGWHLMLRQIRLCFFLVTSTLSVIPIDTWVVYDMRCVSPDT